MPAVNGGRLHCRAAGAAPLYIDGEEARQLPPGTTTASSDELLSASSTAGGFTKERSRKNKTSTTRACQVAEIETLRKNILGKRCPNPQQNIGARNRQSLVIVNAEQSCKRRGPCRLSQKPTLCVSTQKQRHNNMVTNITQMDEPSKGLAPHRCIGDKRTCRTSSYVLLKFRCKCIHICGKACHGWALVSSWKIFIQPGRLIYPLRLSKHKN